MRTDQKLVITGAAGLVCQNLVLMLCERGYRDIVAIDKHGHSLGLLKRLNQAMRVVECDLAEPGPWEREFEGAGTALVLHAQITGKTPESFERNNLLASDFVFKAIARAKVPYTVHISSSVVNSVADDDYTNTRKAQERMFLEGGLPGCVLRPTLLYGWFDCLLLCLLLLTLRCVKVTIPHVGASY